jgi:hypothetical protein|tara:strand:+ start:1105 stop:1638 length:534 start_codon:yes stop_codon:yes gene_type:complete
MKKGVSNQSVDLMKIFHVAAFLFITIFFLLPYLVQVSTYFHEKGHQSKLSKYNVENDYRINLLETIPAFFNPKIAKLGVTTFEVGKYNQLNRFQKADINLAGIISDLRFLFLIGSYFAVFNIFTYYMIRKNREDNLVWYLGLNWVLFMWLLALIQITVANITHSQGDVYHLIRNVVG